MTTAERPFDGPRPKSSPTASRSDEIKRSTMARSERREESKFMNSRRGRLATTCWAAALCASACGGGAEDSPEGDADTSTGGGTGGDTQETTGGSDPGTGGSPSLVDCSGVFGVGVLFFEDTNVTSPALTSDELELFYVDGDETQQTVKRTVRLTTQESFPVGTQVAELNALCGPNDSRTIDVSDDGLRAYVLCYQFEQIEEANHPLLLISRPTRQDPFTGAQEIANFASSPAVSSDELSLIGNTYGSPSTDVATRAALGDTFEGRAPLLGLENVALFAPTLSPDALQIYGANSGAITVATRTDPSSPFGAPTALSNLPEGLSAAGAPEISADCRSLLFVGVSPEPLYRLYRSTR